MGSWLSVTPVTSPLLTWLELSILCTNLFWSQYLPPIYSTTKSCEFHCINKTPKNASFYVFYFKGHHVDWPTLAFRNSYIWHCMQLCLAPVQNSLLLPNFGLNCSYINNRIENHIFIYLYYLIRNFHLPIQQLRSN